MKIIQKQFNGSLWYEQELKYQKLRDGVMTPSVNDKSGLIMGWLSDCTKKKTSSKRYTSQSKWKRHPHYIPFVPEPAVRLGTSVKTRKLQRNVVSPVGRPVTGVSTYYFSGLASRKSSRVPPKLQKGFFNARVMTRARLMIKQQRRLNNST